jgi:hypothetical protein
MVPSAIKYIPVIILILTASVSSAQTIDSIKQAQKQSELKSERPDQQLNGNPDPAKGSARAPQSGNSGNKVIKKLTNARPDMSKARGARPNIIRPSGSGIPRGVGKPGGAGKMRGR